MKLHADTSDTVPTISGHGPGWLAVGQQRHAHSLLLSAGGLLQAWPCARFDDLTAAHFEELARLARDAQVVLLGCGARQRFVPPAWLRPLARQHLALECMTTPAACRTYNILAMEGRAVLAALLV